jgi:predicted nuclease with TOPRIM domain
MLDCVYNESEHLQHYNQLQNRIKRLEYENMRAEKLAKKANDRQAQL